MEKKHERLLQGLNDKQREAVTAADGPVLVIAGPGSGKTRVITTRIAHLIQSGRARPGNIGAITFTRKASEEMTRRLETLLPAYISRGVWTSTFHRLCGSLLRQHGAAAGIKPDFAIANEVQQTNVMRQCMFDASVDIRVTKPYTLVQRMSILKNRMMEPGDPANWGEDEHAQRNAWLSEAYQHVLVKTNTLDFDDMLLGAVTALQNREEARQAASQRLPWVMVDEWQDTNLPQYLLVRMIAQEHRNLFVVGDPDQAIYGWRGAELGNILDFQRDFPETKRIDLDIAYRSSAGLLEAAQAMIRENKDRIEHKLTAVNDGGALTGIHDAIDASDEAAFATDRAAARIARDNGSIAVLYRTNAQSRGFETEFKRAGIRYGITGGKSFYDRPEVQDALCCLQAAVNPEGDDEAIRRFLELPPHQRLGKKGGALIDTMPGATFWERTYRAARSGVLLEWQARSLAVRFELTRTIGRTARNEPLDRALETILQQTGYLDALEGSGDADATERAENVWEVIADAYVFRNDRSTEDDGPEARVETVQAFLDHCGSMRTPDVPGPEVRVTLSTLHRSKGLEFDTVIIGGFDAERLPNRKAMSGAERQDNDIVEEERRLAYVGMTRARTELYLSVPRTIGIGDRQRATHPSPFLEEIPPWLKTTAPEPGSRIATAPKPRAQDEKKREDQAAPFESKRPGKPKESLTMGPYGPEVQL